MPTPPEPATTTRPIARIGVLTSGGDAPGMNAAVRAVVRSGIHAGAEVFAIREGWQGAIDGTGIDKLSWDDVGATLSRGGTIIGTARAPLFREREGLRLAAKHLVQHGIDRLIVIGGDGSLRGADELREEWPSLLAELIDAGELTEEQVEGHRDMYLAGLVGSIDNDMVGTDMTIGTDTALHRITDALDAISSTAASHQRNFVVEVMGRRCGYLAIMSAIAGAADYALFPERPPEAGWERDMCQRLAHDREAGRRESIVVVAEGARDREGNPITAQDVRAALKEHTGEDARVTVLGHVQRGGRPSAYDRWMPTMLGVAAVDTVLAAQPGDSPMVVGVRDNQVTTTPLVEAVQQTKDIATLLDEHDYDEAMARRSKSFTKMVEVFDHLSDPRPGKPLGDRAPRVGIVHCGGLAPGMNSAAMAAARLGHHEGLHMVGIQGGFHGLADGDVRDLGWADVEGWSSLGGAELGSRRELPDEANLYALARSIETHDLDALVVIGGFDAYWTVHALRGERRRFPAFNLPVVCLPASIDNNLPGWPMAIGADTALNAITTMIDQIKQSATAARRCFVVETMGRYCGFLALTGGLSGGAEKVYLHEDGITLAELARDVQEMNESFRQGRRFYLAVRNEEASDDYTTEVLARLFDAESDGSFDVRTSVLGHTQQGGDPSPFDRILATRLASIGITEVSRQLREGKAEMVYAARGQDGKGVQMHDIKTMDDEVEWEFRRTNTRTWMHLRSVMDKVGSRPSNL